MYGSLKGGVGTGAVGAGAAGAAGSPLWFIMGTFVLAMSVVAFASMVPRRRKSMAKVNPKDMDN